MSHLQRRPPSNSIKTVARPSSSKRAIIVATNKAPVQNSAQYAYAGRGPGSQAPRTTQTQQQLANQRQYPSDILSRLSTEQQRYPAARPVAIQSQTAGSQRPGSNANQGAQQSGVNSTQYNAVRKEVLGLLSQFSLAQVEKLFTEIHAARVNVGSTNDNPYNNATASPNQAKLGNRNEGTFAAAKSQQKGSSYRASHSAVDHDSLQRQEQERLKKQEEEDRRRRQDQQKQQQRREEEERRQQKREEEERRQQKREEEERRRQQRLEEEERRRQQKFEEEERKKQHLRQQQKPQAQVRSNTQPPRSINQNRVGSQQQNRPIDPSRSGGAKNWAQLKPDILSAIKRDAEPAVFRALLADVQKMMDNLKRTPNELDVLSVQLQEDAAVIFARRRVLSENESKKALQLIVNVCKNQ